MRKALALLFGAIALGVLAFDVWNGPMQGGELALSSTAELWFTYHRDTWLGVQPTIQKNISPEAWDDYALPLLSAPACVVFGGLALFFLIISPSRRKNANNGLMFPKGRK